MANGSFGLSGIPTAPTTVGVAPNNPFTPVSAVVNSVAGFASGSLIYNRNGDYSTPVSATGTATFPITATEPILSTTVPSWVATPSTASGSATVINNNGGSSGFRYSATLTNGNIVLGYKVSSGRTTRFKIIDENYNVVVPEVTTGLTATTNQNAIGVVALTGGKFVIYALDSSPYFNFAIYNNDGTLAVAAQTDTAQSFVNNWIDVVARPDGSWIVYGPGASAAFYYKVWSATGTQVHAWTTIGTSNSGGGQLSISVRSDNSFVLLWPNTGTNNITYAVRSALNVQTVAPTSTAVTLATGNGLTSVCLSTDAVVFIYQASSSAPISARTLSSANVLGSAVALLSATTDIFNQLSHIDAYLLPSDNYLIGFANTISSSRFYCTINYCVFNSSGTVLSGPTQLLNAVAIINGQSWNIFVRTTNYIHNINYIGQASTTATDPNVAPQVVIGTRISPTTYQIVNNQSTTALVGTTSVQPVSIYAPPTSSVGLAGYYASSNATVTTSIPSTTGVVSGTVIESFVADTMDACSLTGGGVAILYYQVSTGTVKVAIYNISMVLQTTISFTTGFTGTLSAYYKVTQLTNGKLVVTYQTGSQTCAFRVYSTSYALLATVAIPGASFTVGSMAEVINIAPLSGARFVFVIKDSGVPYYTVYSDTGTVLRSLSLIEANGYQFSTITVAANPSGFTFTGQCTSPSQHLLIHYFETTDQSNTFTYAGQWANAATINTYDSKAVTLVNGTCVAPYVQTSTDAKMLVSQYTRGIPGSLSATLNTNYIIIANPVFGTGAIAFVGAPCCGGVAFGVVSASARTLQFYYRAGNITGTAAVTSMTFAIPDISSTAAGYRFIGLYGSIMVLTYLNLANFPSFALINVNTASYNTTLVAGTTLSNATQTLSQATGYSLIGVSATDCPANGSGNVTINGSATLNGSYPETVAGQSFDFSSPTTFGVKGTQINRNINLQGNV